MQYYGKNQHPQAKFCIRYKGSFRAFAGYAVKHKVKRLVYFADNKIFNW
jgi:hypothetical protein